MQPHEEETDDTHLFFLGLDRSPSMEPVEGEVITCFNEVLVPALIADVVPGVGAFRFTGNKFDGRVEPLWVPGADGAWLPLKDTKPKLTTADYAVGGSATALHQAALDAITAAVGYAAKVASITGTLPRTTIALLTDGANNCNPGAAKVKAIADTLSVEQFDLVLIHFQTREIVDANQVAQDMGFRDVLVSQAKPGETLAEQQKRFRNMMGVFSSALVSRSKQSVGQKTAGPSGTGFFSV